MKYVVLSVLFSFTFLSIAMSFAFDAQADQVCVGRIGKKKDCIERSQLTVVTVSTPQLRKVGIFPQSVIAKDGSVVSGLPVQCDVVPNGWGVTLSKTLYAKYISQGFQGSAVCLGMGGEGIHFDPETGKQLPLYVIARDPFKTIHPARLPDCFKKVIRVGGEGSWLVYFKPSCEMKYNPVTGKKMIAGEPVYLVAGGEAGGGVDEDDKGSSISEARLGQLVEGK